MADNNPYRPSPEVLAKLQQLRQEFAVRAEMERRRQLGQQNLEETIKALKLPSQADGGEVDAAMYRTKEPELTLGDRYNKYVVPMINNGLNAMLPMRKLAGAVFEHGIYEPAVNLMKNNRSELSDAEVQKNVEEYKRIKDMELRNKYGLRQWPVQYDTSKFNRRLIPNSFPNPDNPIKESNPRDVTDLFKAHGGQVDMDTMHYELINRAPHHRITHAHHLDIEERAL